MFRSILVLFLLLFTVPTYAHGPDRQVHRCGWVSLDANDITRQQCLKERYFGMAMQSFILAKNFTYGSRVKINGANVNLIIENAYKIAVAMVEKRNSELLKNTEEAEK